jgi:cell division protein FtsW (lipid II flippase)
VYKRQDQGRVLHLTRKYAPDAFNFSRLIQWATQSREKSFDATSRVLRHLAQPLSIFCLFAFITLGTASLFFNDLGGALISTLLVIITLFLTFGARPTFLALGLLGLLATLLSFTDKLQGRIELMLAPMTATVSDFARLLAFTEASSPNGFGLGNIAWCNQDGTCLPIQVLSDYMPTALNGVSGPWMTLLVFLALCLFFLTIAMVSCWRFITRQGVERFISVVTFFLLTATLIQTILTFLGNWRLIPLTGMGTPLMSIGLSSILAPTLALGFFLTFSANQNSGLQR